MKIWDKQRIEKEKILVKNFGLNKKKEIWMSEALLMKYRRMARELAAKKDKAKEKVLLEKLIKLGLLQEGAGLDDVLDLNLESFLERRLQTVLQKKGFVNSVKQARQFIVHGHVRIGERKIVYPGYLVSKSDEEKIQISMTVNKPKVVQTGS